MRKRTQALLVTLLSFLILIICVIGVLAKMNPTFLDIIFPNGPRVIIRGNSPLPTVKVNPDPSTNNEDWYLTPPVKGKDDSGNEATFEFYTLIGVNHDYGWEFGSWETIQDGLNKLSMNANKFLDLKLNQRGMKYRIENASDIISVGVASCEGYKQTEEARAEKRAKVIRRSVEPIAKTIKGNLYLLLLGQYSDESCPAKSPEETLVQRSVIIIGVVQKDQNVNLKQAVRSAMSNLVRDQKIKQSVEKLFQDPSRSPLGVLKPDKYTLFDLKV